MRRSEEPTLLAELAARDYLARHGVPLVPASLVRSVEELRRAVEAHGPDLVLKGSAPWLIHKTDLGLVRVGVPANGAEEAFHELMDARMPAGRIDGVIVEPRLGGVEAFVGARRDPALGPFVAVGAGGIMVEHYDDVAFAPAPIDASGALSMIEQLRFAGPLSGPRGLSAVDLGGLARLVSQISQLVLRDERLAELDLNPVFLTEHGVTVADARAVLAPARLPAWTRPARDLRPLLNPRSIAVIGASTDPGKLGARIVRYLVDGGFDGRILPIHRTASEIHGQEVARSVADAGDIDLACVVVPPEGVHDAVVECGDAGVRNVIVHTSGFAEAAGRGRAGTDAQIRLADAARRRGINLCGPNSLGVISPRRRVFASFAGALESSRILPGRIGFVSQSGALASTLLSRSVDDDVGFSRWISTGNEADLDLADFIGYLADDEETSLIAIFMEQIREGASFREAVRRAIRAGKPVIAYKSGRSDAGQRAAQSHTGALAGDDRLYASFLADAGVVRVPFLRDLLQAARVMVATPMPRGRRLAAVTMSGGASSIIADVAAAVGLSLPPLAAAETCELRDLLPSAATVGNPLDVTAAAMVDPSILTSVVASLLQSSSVDMVLVQLTTNADPVAAEMADGLVQLHRAAEKPLILSRLGSPRLAPAAMEVYRSASVPVLDWPEDATRVASALARAGEAMAEVAAERNTEAPT